MFIFTGLPPEEHIHVIVKSPRKLNIPESIREHGISLRI